MSEMQLDLTGCKILIVDDVPANLDVLVQALDQEGYNVLVASDGPTALEVAAYSQPDLILLDVMMPEMNGYEACRRLKGDAKLASIPVIFLTARDDIEGIVEGFDAGGLDYCTKPFKKEEILVRIQTHLERTLLARQLAALNAELEQKVEERTREVRRQLKELEGKDRIAQHLLTLHSLEETLALVTEVVSDLIELDRVIVYVKEGEKMTSVAAVGLELPDSALGKELQQTLPSEYQQALITVQDRGEPVNIDNSDHPFAILPIMQNESVLGLFVVENNKSKRPISAANLKTVSSFALQAAVAIRDAQVNANSEDWKEQLDEILELDQEMGEAEQLEDMDRELEH